MDDHVDGSQAEDTGSGDHGAALSDQELLAFAQGELTDRERQRVELALDASPENAEIVAEYARIFGTVGPEDADTLVAGAVDDSASGAVPTLAVGSQLGRYLIIGELGRGGMGVVLRAYDPKLQREVALKVLGPAGMSAETQARLVREAQVMAQLNHRNVVSVYDVAQIGERFVLAMEYVEGMNLGQWLVTERVGWSRVLEVFIAAGRGVMAAHQAGLLHRDFKPANVLISSAGEVKVTDFGIARVEEASSVSLTPGVPTLLETGDVVYDASAQLTEDGEVVGTPAYMPLEQFEGKTTTAAADQYAFCVSLWQGLTGTLPFGPQMGERVEAVELVRRKAAGPPRWPSSASAVPKRFVDAIRRGLAVDVGARWPSMAALLSELSVDPLQTRRRLGVGAGLLAVVGGVLGWQAYERARVSAECEAQGRAIEDTWNASRSGEVARGFRRSGITYAPDTWTRARARVDAFATQWSEVRTEVCLDEQVHEARGPRLSAMAGSCLAEQHARLGSLIEQWLEPDGIVVERVGTVAWSLPRPRDCVDEDELMRRGDGAEDPQVREAVQAVRERLAEASALMETGRYAEAFERAESVLERAEALGVPSLSAAVRRVAGESSMNLGRYEESTATLEVAYREAYVAGDDAGALRAANLLTFAFAALLVRTEPAHRWSWLARMGQERLMLPEDHPSRAISLNNIGVLRLAEGKPDEARDAFEDALAYREAALGPDHPEVIAILGNLGRCYMASGAYEHAERVHQRTVESWETTLGPEHPKLAVALNQLGNVYVSQGRHEDALEALQRSLSIREAALPPEHPDIAATLANIGSAHNELRRYDLALAAHRRALAILEAKLGEEHPNVASALNNVGNTYQQMGEYEQARASFERALGIVDAVLGEDHIEAATLLNNLGIVYKELGEPERARSAYGRAFELLAEAFGEDHPYAASAQVNIGFMLHAEGRYEEALEVFERALVSLEKAFSGGSGHSYVAIALYGVGLQHVERSRPAEALPPLRRALEIFAAVEAPPPEAAETHFALARAQWELAETRALAVASARAALEGLLRLAPRRTAQIEEIRAWLRGHERDGARARPQDASPASRSPGLRSSSE